MGLRSGEERSGCVNAIPFLDERGVASEVIVGVSSGKNFFLCSVVWTRGGIASCGFGGLIFFGKSGLYGCHVFFSVFYSFLYIFPYFRSFSPILFSLFL